MSGTGKEYLGSRRQENELSTGKLKAYVDCPIISDAIAATTVGTTEAIQIPAGAYVFGVGVFASSALANVVIDVGDGTDTDGFVDGLTTLAANDLAMAPVPGNGVGSDEVAGKYYSTADTIDVRIVTATATGTLKLMVWYFMP